MKNIKQEVEKLQKEMVQSIWEYRRDELSECGISKKDIVNECGDLSANLDTFESFFWEMGYVYAMKELLGLMNEEQEE